MKKALKMFKKNMCYIIGIVLINALLVLVMLTAKWGLYSAYFITVVSIRNVVMLNLAMSFGAGGLMVFSERAGKKGGDRPTIASLLFKKAFYVSACWALLSIVALVALVGLTAASFHSDVAREIMNKLLYRG